MDKKEAIHSKPRLLSQVLQNMAKPLTKCVGKWLSNKEIKAKGEHENNIFCVELSS